MKTYNGQLRITKKEIKELELLIDHVQRDISYGSAGSFGDGDKFFVKEATKVEKAVAHLKWIISLQN